MSVDANGLTGCIAGAARTYGPSINRVVALGPGFADAMVLPGPAALVIVEVDGGETFVLAVHHLPRPESPG